MDSSANSSGQRTAKRREEGRGRPCRLHRQVFAGCAGGGGGLQRVVGGTCRVRGVPLWVAVAVIRFGRTASMEAVEWGRSAPHRVGCWAHVRRSAGAQPGPLAPGAANRQLWRGAVPRHAVPCCVVLAASQLASSAALSSCGSGCTRPGRRAGRPWRGRTWPASTWPPQSARPQSVQRATVGHGGVRGAMQQRRLAGCQHAPGGQVVLPDPNSSAHLASMQTQSTAAKP